MAVEIRPADRLDLEELLSLRERAAAERVWIGSELPLDRKRDRAQFKRGIESDHAALFVADADDDIVGWLGLDAPIGIADLGMAISPDHRGRGIGAQLVEAGIEWARANGVHKISLEMWPWNHRARNLYERYGFEEEGYRRRHYRRKDGSLWDALVMGLVLDEDAPGHVERAGDPPPPLS